MRGAYGTNGTDEKCIQDFCVGKPEGKRTLIKVDLKEILWEGVDLIHLAENRDQWLSSCEHGNELSSYKMW
jgi:hypothetical protein